jgi:hypothetical protein
VPSSSTSNSAQRQILQIPITSPNFNINYINTTTMNSYNSIEDRIAEALQSIEKNLKPNFTKLAKKFAVPYLRLINRAKGRGSKSERQPANLRLNDTKELVLCWYLNTLERAGLYVCVYQIHVVASSILNRRSGYDSDRPLGKLWTTRFLQCHPEYHIRKQRLIDIERKDAHNQRDIDVFYERWKRVIEEFGVHPADIYNVDETGF